MIIYFSWQTTSQVTTALDSATSVAYNGYVYQLGGQTITPTQKSTVSYALIEPAGYLGGENTYSTYPLQSANSGSVSVTYNGYIYVLGGYSGSASQEVDARKLGPKTL